MYMTTQEARDAFKQLLSDVGITGSMQWDETMRIIAQDRWGRGVAGAGCWRPSMRCQASGRQRAADPSTLTMR